VQKCPQAGRTFKSPAALEWLDCFSESNSILSAILAVIHPDLYEAGRETFKRLREAPGIERQDVLSRWTSVFNGVSVISNRTTPVHRDGNSLPHWYDILVTLGDYSECNMKLPGLGVSLEYGPGTVVGLSGMVLQHEVPSFKGKDRVCYAYFMRNNVHHWAKVSPVMWMHTNFYK
jgi:Oxygenase domain of the 2OGFeDO superfamily